MRDPVRDDEIDVLLLVRHRHVLRSAARPELDDDVLAKEVFHQGERLLEHIYYILLPKEASARYTTFSLRTILHKIRMTNLQSTHRRTDGRTWIRRGR